MWVRAGAAGEGGALPSPCGSHNYDGRAFGLLLCRGRRELRGRALRECSAAMVRSGSVPSSSRRPASAGVPARRDWPKNGPPTAFSDADGAVRVTVTPEKSKDVAEIRMQPRPGCALWGPRFGSAAPATFGRPWPSD